MIALSANQISPLSSLASLFIRLLLSNCTLTLLVASPILSRNCSCGDFSNEGSGSSVATRHFS
jgi:hypothetical protein